jgi:prepilin-type N-terminal cleavage/methylation domain-containing protein
MLSRARDEDGFTLIEVLVACVLFVIVLGAILGVFEAFARTTAQNASQNDVQDQLRTVADRVARELRSAGGPSQAPGQGTPTLERAAATDLVFQTVDPRSAGSGSNPVGLQRVRLCTNQSDPQRAVLWRQVQTWTTALPPSLPASTVCPAAAYGTQAVLTDHLVNYASGQVRPLFTYDAPLAANVAAVDMQLFADWDLRRLPKEERLRTGVHLRNLNRAPTAAAFTWTATGNRHVLLNGTSSDPDGDPLTFSWYEGSTLIGKGATLDDTAPSTAPRSISLTVSDPSGLTSSALPQEVIAR